jgi:AAA family ATP:ADP antiporter
MNPYQLMIVAAGGLVVCILLTWAVDGISDHRVAAKPISGQGGFRLVLGSRYLLLIAFMVLLFNMVNSLGEYMLGELVVSDVQSAVAAGTIAPAEAESRIGAFYGSFFGSVNLIGLLLQIFVVSRVFKYIGVRGALFILPLIALGSYGLMAMLPVLGVVRIAKVLENSTDYSIQNTARHALFLPTSREAKYKAKAAIDSFFWRTGDVLQAGVVKIGTTLALTTQQFAGINIGFIAVWLFVVVGLYRLHKKMVPDNSVRATN